VDDADIQAFVRRFAHVAQAEQDKYGIPASVILAHGLLKSQAGQAQFAAQGNNFFALTCTDDWDDQTQDDPTRTYTCLRKYDNAWLSFRDHSLFYTTGKHTSLRNIGANDYQAWAKALRKSKYNDVKALDDQLLAIIARLSLTQYDGQ
jgi:flagellum-specific peptidoglycan hydrolase FlgJ